MSSDLILLIARLMMAALFFAGGITKLLGEPAGRAAIAGLGLPAAGSLNRLAGLCLVGGSAMLASGVGTRLAAALLAAFVALVTPLFLRFWAADEPVQRAKLMQAFLGNIGVVGGLLAFAAVGPGGLSLLPAT